MLETALPANGIVLEVASGTGEHAVHFARAFVGLQWQPSDPDPDNLRSIRAWQTEAGLPNLGDPLSLDVRDPDWPIDRADALVAINMIHIAPWEATLGLMRGAGRILGSGAPLYIYGPFIREEIETAPSNIAFDASLRGRNPAWGIRPIEAVAEAAAVQGLDLQRIEPMPANNLSVIFRRRDRERVSAG